MNPVLRELQRQLNDIAKQLAALQRQETVLSNPVTYSGTPTANSMAYWTGAGTVAHASFGTADVVRTSGDQTITGDVSIGSVGSFGSKFSVVDTSNDIASFEVDGTYARVYFVSYRDSALTHGEFKGRASRGSKDSPTAIQSGDLIFAIRAEGYGTDAWPGGVTSEVSLEADGNHTNTSQPGRIVFKTAKSGATGSTEAMRIDAQQRVTVPSGIRSGVATVADDSFTLLAAADIPARGMLFLATGVNADEAAIIAYRLDATSVCTLMVGMGATAVSTATLNGTTGADNFCTVSATTSGLYIENRHGTSRAFRYLLMGE